MAWLKIGATALIGSMLALAPQAVAAAPGGVQVSPDGITFSSTYPGALFDSLGNLVPMDSDESTFYVRNDGAEPGHLRITLKDVVAADADFADALTVSASTVGQAGPAATLLSVNPCWVLLQNVVLSPGQTIAVTARLALGDLQGTAGQNADASFALGVALSSAAVSLPPTHCGAPDSTIPGTRPTTAQRPIVAGSAQQAPNGASIVPPVGAPAVDLPVLNLPEMLGIDPNTWRLFEEYLVFVLIGAFLLGTVCFWLVARRRRKSETEPQEMDTTG